MSTLRLTTVVPSPSLTVRSGSTTLLDSTVASNSNASLQLTGGLRIAQTNSGTSLTSPGGLYCAGGVGINGNVYTAGTFISSNGTQVTSTSTGSVQLGGGLLVSDKVAFSTGFGHYVTGSSSSNMTLSTLTNTTSGIAVNVANFIRDATQKSVVRCWSLGAIDTDTNQEYIEWGYSGVGYVMRTARAGTGVHRSLSMSATASVTDQLVLGTDSTVSMSGVVTVSNTTDSTSSSTGAFKVSGGLHVAKRLTLGLNANSGGLRFLDGTNAIAGSIYQTGTGHIVYEDSTGHQFAGAITVTSGTVTVSDTTESTSTSSGSLVSSGGIGIAKNAFVGGAVATSTMSIGYSAVPVTGMDLQLHGDRVIQFTSASTGTTTSDGFRITKNSNDDAILTNMEAKAIFLGTSATNRVEIQSTGQVRALVTTDASSTATGSLQTLGGLGVAKNLYVGQSAYINNVEVFPSSEDRFRQVSFTLANTTTNGDVTGLVFTTSNLVKLIGQVRINLTIGGTPTVESFDITCQKGALGLWSMSYTSYGDLSTISFAITTGGQIQYTLPTVTNFSSATFNYRVWTIV